MDDYKRMLYMAAQARLRQNAKRSSSLSVCCTLESMLMFEGHCSSERDVEEYFPEFQALYDGSMWHHCTTLSPESNKAARGGYWWSPNELAPRLRAIDCLLRD